MFKKIFLFSLTLITGLLAQTGDSGALIPLLSGSQKLYTWEVDNDTAIVSQGNQTTSAVLTMLRTRTKATDPCSSATRSPLSYISWWTDSTDIVTNRTFGTNIAGWDSLFTTGYVKISNVSCDTLKQVASFGGLSNVLYAVSSSAMVVSCTESMQLRESGKYRFQADVYIDSIESGAVRLYIKGYGTAQVNALMPVVTVGSTKGLKEIDVIFTATTSSYLPSLYPIDIQFQHSVSDQYLRLAIDNVSLYPVKDSSQTMSKILTGLPEATDFYWYSSIFEITKGKTGVCAIDTFYSRADTDTFTTPTNRPTNFVATGDVGHIDLTWSNTSAIELGYIILRDTIVGGVGFVAIDTTAANATSYIDNTVIDGGTYRYKILTYASINSDTVGIESATVIPAPVAPDHYLVNKDGGKILMKGRVYAIKFKEN